MDKRVTLKDVAASVGVSVSAVSMALRDHPRISPAMRKQIKATAAKLGYVYNRHAANLRKGVSDNISVCINDLRNPVFWDILIGIEEEFRKQGKLVVLCNANENLDIQYKFLKMMFEQGSAGVLLSPVAGSDLSEVRAITRDVFPLVLFSRSFDKRHFDQVVNDDALGIQLAIENLHSLGHRRIAYIGGGKLTSTAQNRFAGYIKALQDFEIPINENLIIHCGHTSLPAGQEAMLELLKVKPGATAVVCFGDLLALGAVSACRSARLKVGSDISIIGYDDIEEASFCEPALSTIRMHKQLIGRTAARLLLERINEPGRRPEMRTIKPELVIRNTVGRFLA